MNLSQAGIKMIKEFEGCRLQAYLSPYHVWSIGYGHTGDDVYAGKTITQADADLILTEELKRYETYVDETAVLALNQNQFDALVSFTFNLGLRNLRMLIQNRNHAQIADAMLLYVNYAGKPLNGLVRRRAEERRVYLSAPAENAQKKDQINVVRFSMRADGKTSVSSNFKVSEFQCRDGSDLILIDIGFVKEKLQKIREHFGMPVKINSGYRTESHNKKTGGASGSYHLKGRAFDISVKGATPLEVARFAQELGIAGIIRYNTFVHVDNREAKYWAHDRNGKVTLIENF